MSIDAFVDWASKADPAPSPDGEAQQLAFVALGLLADAGEVADLLKKHLAGGELDRNHLAHELGDVLLLGAALRCDRNCAVGAAGA